MDATPVTSDNVASEQANAVAADDGGVLLQEVKKGAAADVAGLRVGDVILSFGGVRTHNFEELRNAVQQACGPVKVIFINGENGQAEYLTVTPEEGRIGVTCE
jgi:S1-C subfamily serine protease